MTKIKICGLTNSEDVHFAARAGADLLGFVFYPKSPRYIEPLTARTVIRELKREFPTVLCVGLFVDEPVDLVRSVLDTCTLDVAQLHGHEPPAVVSALGGRAFRAIRPRSAAEADDALADFGVRTSPPDLLVDTYSAHKPGGTGEIGDWELAAHVASQRNILLAGGLTPQNVAAAIQRVHPWGVDVSSGVESEPGRKSHQAIAAFIAAVQKVMNGKNSNR